MRAISLASGQGTVQSDHKDKNHQRSVDPLGIPGQPVGQVNIEIVHAGVRILPGDQGQGTIKFKQDQGQAFQKHQAKADPEPSVEFIRKGCVKHIKNNHIEKKPDRGVDDFDQDKFGPGVHGEPVLLADALQAIYK